MKNSSIKKRILNILTESLITGDKTKMKEVLKSLKTNKKFRELYLFYEEIEKKYFDDKQLAEKYVEILSEQLIGDLNFLRDGNFKFLFDNIKENEIKNEELYYNLDILREENNLKNIDKKLIAKKFLVEHLQCKKVTEESDELENTMNENLLNTVLVNNFNNYYDMSLNEEEKKELKDILSMNNEDVEKEFITLKEDVSSKLNNLINESNGELKEKLVLTNEELSLMKLSKINLYKLKKLNSGLN